MDFIQNINVGMIVAIPLVLLVLTAVIAILSDKPRGGREITSEPVCVSDSKETKKVGKIKTLAVLERDGLASYHSNKVGERIGTILDFLTSGQARLRLPNGAIVRRQISSLKPV